MSREEEQSARKVEAALRGERCAIKTCPNFGAADVLFETDGERSVQPVCERHLKWLMEQEAP